MKHFYVICSFCALLLTAQSLSAKELVINVPAMNGDAGDVLRNAIEQAKQENGKPVIIRLTQGTYHLYAATASKHIYYMSNTASESENPDPTKHIGVWLKGLKNVTIDGGGAKLMMHGEMTGIIIDECENVKLSNLSVDYADPSVSEMTIIDCGNNYFTAQVHPDSHYQIENNTITWTGENWAFKGGIAQLYDPARDITWRTFCPQCPPAKVIELEPGLLRFSYPNKPNVEVGYTFQMRDGIRDEASGFIHKSRNVQLENINLYFLGNFSMLVQYTENITLTNVNFEPEPGSGRTCAGFADLLHLSGCKGKIKVTNCRFSGAHDDPINIHGTHLKVIEYLSANQVKLRFMHNQTYGIEAFFVNDQIEFINQETLLATASNTVKSVQRVSNTDVILTLQKPLSKEIIANTNLVVENATWTPEVEIKRNYFSRIPTRGILVSTRKKVLIEENTFFRMQMSGILIADDAQSWYESGMVRDVTIRRNNFIECGAPVIYIAPENHKNAGAVHRNIKIEENRFVLLSKDAINAKSVDGLTIKGNLFITKDQISSPEQLIHTQDCFNVVQANNRIEQITK